jgi:hypothetical protein
VDTVPGLGELQVRRRELLLESELNRQVLRLEVDQLSIRVGQIQRRFGWAQSAWKWAAPVAGVLLARNFKKTGHAFAKGSFLITAVQTGWKIWRSFRSNRAESDSGN